MHLAKLIIQPFAPTSALYRPIPQQYRPSAPHLSQRLFTSNAWTRFRDHSVSFASNRFKQLAIPLSTQQTKQIGANSFKILAVGTALATLCLHLKDYSEQAHLNASLETIWPELLYRMDTENIPNSNKAKTIRNWLNDPSNAKAIQSVRYLRLNHYKLTTLPPEIGLFTQLRWLSLSDNKLTALPPEISNLTELSTLDLSRNQLTTRPPELDHLKKLTYLDLSYNPLKQPENQIQKPEQPLASSYPPIFE